MKQYKYKVKNNKGVVSEGLTNAMTKEEAMAKLRQEYPVVVSLREYHDKEDFRDTLHIRRVNEKNLSLVCEQFAIILKAGLPVLRAVEMVAQQTSDGFLKEILWGVAEDVAGGKRMADSFEERGPKLPLTFIETIRAGEESGALDVAFERLSNFFKKKSDTRAKVISALTYPAMVVGVAIVVIVIIMLVAVPQFTEAYESMGTELPLPTRMVIGISDFFVNWFWLLALIIIALIVALKVYERKPENKILTDGYRLRIPLIGRVHRMNACSQFSHTLSTMLYAGLPVVRALEITGRSMSNRFMGNTVMQTVEDVKQGFRIGKSLKSKKAFPDLLTEMTTVGEETGSMEQTLDVIGEFYDNEVDVVTTRAMKILEPTIICILAVFVLLILLAVYAPMFSMYDNVDALAG